MIVRGEDGAPLGVGRDRVDPQHVLALWEMQRPRGRGRTGAWPAGVGLAELLHELIDVVVGRGGGQWREVPAAAEQDVEADAGVAPRASKPPPWKSASIRTSGEVVRHLRPGHGQWPPGLRVLGRHMRGVGGRRPAQRTAAEARRPGGTAGLGRCRAARDDGVTTDV